MNVHDIRPSTRVGCSNSLIPEHLPQAELATPTYDGLRKYELLAKVIKTTLYASGRFPSSLKQGDFLKNLIEEAIALGVALLDKSDAEIISGAKAIARKLIHREKKEVRWDETEPDGKKVRHSRSEMRIEHPVQRHGKEKADPLYGAEGDLEWQDPMAEVGCDAVGNFLGVTAHNFNEVEARMIENLDRLALRLRVINAIGPENYRWMTEYVDRKRGGIPIPAVDRTRFKVLRTKCKTLKNKVLELTNGSQRR